MARGTIESSVLCCNALETGIDALVAGHVQLNRLEGGFEVAELGDGILCCRQTSRYYQDAAILESLSNSLSNAEANASVCSGDQDAFRH
jgi:hypothetical protein